MIIIESERPPEDGKTYRYVVTPSKRGWVVMTQAEEDQRVADKATSDAKKAPRLIDKAWRHCEKLMNEGTVSVEVSNGNTYLFGTDPETRENVMGLNTAIAAGIAIPSPRDYWPKGETSPIQATHADFAAIGGALLSSKDAYIQVYLTHKANLKANAANTAALETYDITSGYDALT